MKTELLRQLDTLTDSSVIVLACTNAPSLLDPALRRRLPQMLPIDPPGEDDRFEILKRLHQEESIVEETLLRQLARATLGLTGADLATLYRDASSSRLDEVLEDWKDEETNGATLMARAGPLCSHHWEQALLRRGIKLVSYDET